MGKATGQHQLIPANDSGFFAAEGKLHRNSRVENACYVFETANLSTVWNLFGEAGKDSSSTWSREWQIWRDTEFAAYLRPWSLLRLTANRRECFWEASVILFSSRKRLHCRGTTTCSSQAKPPAKGFQPLLASWVHEKVKNYATCVQIPNSVTHCFTEQEAKQLTLMTECKGRKK